MSEKEIKIDLTIDEEGFCKNCKNNHDCFNCTIMDEKIVNELDLYKNSLISLLDKKENKIEKVNKQIPTCGDCGYKMKESKFKTGPAYWCPRCKGN